HEDDELAVADRQVELAHRARAVRVDLRQLLELDRRHGPWRLTRWRLSQYGYIAPFDGSGGRGGEPAASAPVRHRASRLPGHALDLPCRALHRRARRGAARPGDLAQLHRLHRGLADG